MTDISSRETVRIQAVSGPEMVLAADGENAVFPALDPSTMTLKPSVANRSDSLSRLNALLTYTTLKLMVSLNGVRYAVKSVAPGRTPDTIMCSLIECDACVEVRSVTPLLLFVDSPHQTFRGSLT